MGNSIKRFLSNKNTVTILGVILGVIILIIAYNIRVSQAVDPVTVPYAKQELTSRTRITEAMIGSMDVPKSMVSGNSNLITNANQVIGKYVSYGTNIPANSLFYTGQLIDYEEMPDSAFADIPDNYTIFSLSVNLDTTYGNSIYPGNYIDLYFKAVDETGKVIFGKFIESIEVLAVKDSSGNHVFETTVESRTPAVLLFAVPNDMFSLLEKAGYIGGSGVEIKPVPRNAAYSQNPGETQVSSQYIKTFILAKTAILPEESSYTNPGTTTGQ